MKIVQINSVNNGSTGKIMNDIASGLVENGHHVHNFTGRGVAKEKYNNVITTSKLSLYFHTIMTRLFDRHGLHSTRATKKLVKSIKIIDPDVIHLHNIHGYYLNYKVLFRYLRSSSVKVIWTLHDAWSFTGHCAYYTAVNCDKFKTKCYSCPQTKNYPSSRFFSRCQKNFNDKKNLYSSMSNLTIVTPSYWLKGEVKKSFLSGTKTIVINNGIDKNLFTKDINQDIFNKYNIPKNKKIILGVASIWEERKGIEDFYKLAKKITVDYHIVLVGCSKEQIKSNIHKNITMIARTDNQAELVNIYSISHVFVNPTYEDNYPTVNLEASTIGLPIITYDTGGSKECLTSTDLVTKKKDFREILAALNSVKTPNENYVSDVDNMVSSYIDIYQK